MENSKWISPRYGDKRIDKRIDWHTRVKGGSDMRGEYRVDKGGALFTGGGRMELEITLLKDAERAVFLGGGHKKIRVISFNPKAEIIVQGGGDVDLYVEGLRDESQVEVSGGGSKKVTLNPISDEKYKEYLKKGLEERLRAAKAVVKNIEKEIRNLDS